MNKLKIFYLIIIGFLIIYILYLITKINSINTFIIGNQSDNIWYSDKDLIKHDIIEIDDIHGYVLPHAGTKYTGSIISHTLRFKPTKYFNKVIILYLPSSNKPNINNKFYHEYYVPYESIKYFIENNWNISNVNYIEHNILDNKEIKYDKDSLIIVSADFSHFLLMEDAIDKENKAAHALLHKEIDKNEEYIDIIDDNRTFKKLFEIIPKEYNLQWIGRTRSEGDKAVGYLSFLIREHADPHKFEPDGQFITAYDEKMNQRECLGEWYSIDRPWTNNIEDILKNNVIHLGQTRSRLTGGRNKDIPITNYTITYLYLDENNEFIRGWHGTRYNAFYLADVFLENTYDNGKWMSNESEWPSGDTFNMDETIQKLNMKSGINSKSELKLYTSNEIHVKI